jgi:hypothetical protein
VAGSALIGARPAVADGTRAGTTIHNQATATYTDPNNPGTLNAISNQVSITVAEIAGIEVSGTAIIDSTPATGVLPTDDLTFVFTVRNSGNDTTRFHLPGAPTLTGPATINAGSFEYSLDGTTWLPIPGAGVDVPVAPAVVLAGNSVQVRVTVKVDPAAVSGATIAVTLGDVPPNDNSPATQNQGPVVAPGASDVYTVDAGDTDHADEADGAPANGTREASYRQQVLVGAQQQAFAAVLKVRPAGAYNNNGTPAVLNDDRLTYNLSLRVDTAAPAGASPSLVPADLEGAPVSVDGVVANRVLVSDAIPANMNLAAAIPAASVPAGWQAVYTISPTGTTANSALWTVAPPADLTTVTRVGFWHPGPIARGTTVSGFTFETVTESGVVTTTTIANIAQAFGETVGDTTNALVYDESGDQMASNFNDDGTTGSSVPTNGVANPAADGIDANNDNTGTGPGGEDNTFTIAAPGTIFNGPNGFPQAVGPTDSDDDFTNKASVVDVGWTSPHDAPSVSFTNTLQNPGATPLSNVLLIPTAPAVPGDLPAGTIVSITLAGNTANYTYNGTAFVFSSGTAIVVPPIGAGATLNYTVVVDLPSVAFSTDTAAGTPYPVPLRAFVDVDLDGAFDAGEPSNITIDRVYFGFLRVRKEAQILSSTGAVLQAWTETPSLGLLAPNGFIDYRITMTNITSPPAGSNNIILNAGSVVLTDDGRNNSPNNWALDTDGNTIIDTSNVIGLSALAGGAGTISFFSGAAGTTPSPDQTGTTQATDVTKYEVSVTSQIAPQSTVTFSFRRRVN